MRTLTAFVIAVALLAPVSVSGQRLAARFATARFAFSSVRFGVDSNQARTIPQTYWLEGGLIGGASLGVLSALWFRGISDSGSVGGTVAGFVFGGAVGFTAGALIGGQFRKHA